MTLHQGTMPRSIAALSRRHPRLSLLHVPNDVSLSLPSACQWPFVQLLPHVAKRAETRECPICGVSIPLRLLGQHYTLESSRVQAILDHVGDLEGFSDPHASSHAPYVCPLRVLPPPISTQPLRDMYAHTTPGPCLDAAQRHIPVILQQFSPHASQRP